MFRERSRNRILISEITYAELLFGVENAPNPEKIKKALDYFLTGVEILPVFPALELFAKEKSRLKRAGMMIDDFDLLIGVTAVYHDLTMVTHNRKHFERLENIRIEDWITA